jgi:hypothetical protein
VTTTENLEGIRGASFAVTEGSSAGPQHAVGALFDCGDLEGHGLKLRWRYVVKISLSALALVLGIV